MIKEITARELNIDGFINEKIKEIKEIVGDGMAINALSGGADSSTVTMLGHRALGNRLKTAFIDNGIMREGEAGQVAALFRNLGVKVEVIDAQGVLLGIQRNHRPGREARGRDPDLLPGRLRTYGQGKRCETPPSGDYLN